MVFLCNPSFEFQCARSVYSGLDDFAYIFSEQSTLCWLSTVFWFCSNLLHHHLKSSNMSSDLELDGDLDVIELGGLSTSPEASDDEDDGKDCDEEESSDSDSDSDDSDDSDDKDEDNDNDDENKDDDDDDDNDDDDDDKDDDDDEDEDDDDDDDEDDEEEDDDDEDEDDTNDKEEDDDDDEEEDDDDDEPSDSDFEEGAFDKEERESKSSATKNKKNAPPRLADTTTKKTKSSTSKATKSTKSPTAEATKSTKSSTKPIESTKSSTKPIESTKSSTTKATKSTKSPTAEATKSTKSSTAEATKSTKSSTTDPTKSTKSPTAEATKSTKSATTDATKSTKSPTAEATKSTKSPTAEATKSTKSSTTDATKSTKSSTTEPTKSAKKSTAEATNDAATKTKDSGGTPAKLRVGDLLYMPSPAVAVSPSVVPASVSANQTIADMFASWSSRRRPIEGMAARRVDIPTSSKLLASGLDGVAKEAMTNMAVVFQAVQKEVDDLGDLKEQEERAGIELLNMMIRVFLTASMMNTHLRPPTTKRPATCSLLVDPKDVHGLLLILGFKPLLGDARARLGASQRCKSSPLKNVLKKVWNAINKVPQDLFDASELVREICAFPFSIDSVTQRRAPNSKRARSGEETEGAAKKAAKEDAEAGAAIAKRKRKAQGGEPAINTKVLKASMNSKSTTNTATATSKMNPKVKYTSDDESDKEAEKKPSAKKSTELSLVARIRADAKKKKKKDDEEEAKANKKVEAEEKKKAEEEAKKKADAEAKKVEANASSTTGEKGKPGVTLERAIAVAQRCPKIKVCCWTTLWSFHCTSVLTKNVRSYLLFLFEPFCFSEIGIGLPKVPGRPTEPRGVQCKFVGLLVCWFVGLLVCLLVCLFIGLFIGLVCLFIGL